MHRFAKPMMPSRAARAEDILCVEMEASALYTFGKIAGRTDPVSCARDEHYGTGRRRF